MTKIWTTLASLLHVHPNDFTYPDPLPPPTTMPVYNTRRCVHERLLAPSPTRGTSLLFSSSRTTTIHDTHPTDVHMQGSDQKFLISKLNTTSVSMYSPRRIPVPSLHIQDPDKVP